MLKKQFNFLLSSYDVSNSVGCSYDYADQIYRFDKYTKRRDLPDYKTRKEVFERDNYACVVCGSEEKLNIHHISTHENKLDNLVTLCSNCHLKAHDGCFTNKKTAYGSADNFWEWIRQVSNKS
jgi:5-methylcytosine-specific restriction endonuclease McrA